MKITYVVVLMLFSICSFETENEPLLIMSQPNDSEYHLEVFDFEELQKILSTNNDKTYVVNFWATWCAPCVKELPYFEKLNTKYTGSVEVILVSLDFPSQYETKLKPFIKKKQLESRVIALNDVDANAWIPKVDESWTGAIPATIIFNRHKRKFYEKSFEYDELETAVKQFLK